ncbi:HDOD domain-containing protein [Marinobacterium sp. AK62]|uniref:HDOD domain-containing protein n=1 Tax=Marinobacterium alkalitolerans TaxID=1542925 RepID=A0ABS3ZAI0_9GAMM|nr:HDOD domain-containing protein [Marinobacterium alkalitolerans]MBP0048711.1 HDOD domain-containing protein [Marinobacterium alkalitolerans]
MDATSDQSQALLARQPIFDHQQRVIAYELLYGEDHHLDAMAQADPDAESSSELLLHAYTSISDQGEIKRVPAFIQVNPQMILDGNVPALPPKQVVLCIRLADPKNMELLRAVHRMVKEGYRFALTDFEFSPEYDTALKLAKIVKIDVGEKSADELAELAAQLSPYKSTILASNISQFDTLENCIETGCKLFQGSFLSKPKVVKGRKISTNQIAMMQLIQELQKPNTTPEKLEDLIIRDPILTYKLLRIVNSAAYSLVRQVESVAQAVVLLGMEQVRKWASLIAMSSNNEKPEELTRILLTRGHMCEMIAETEKLPNPSGYFMVGMMSGLHAMLDIDQETLLEQLPLGEDIKQALARGEGPMGKILNQVIAYESGDWDLLPSDFDVSLFEAAYRHSLKWTKEAMQAMYED